MENTKPTVYENLGFRNPLINHFIKVAIGLKAIEKKQMTWFLCAFLMQ